MSIMSEEIICEALGVTGTNESTQQQSAPVQNRDVDRIEQPTEGQCAEESAGMTDSVEVETGYSADEGKSAKKEPSALMEEEKHTNPDTAANRQREENGRL